MLELPDGSVLMHGTAPYDPVKAHEYYLKTRELKGRKAGNQPPPQAQHRPRKTSYTVTGANGKSVRLSPQQLQEQKAYATKRVAQLKQNLQDLSVLLRDKLQKAKEAEKKSSKPPTLAEKAKAARESAKYRDSHQQEIATKAKAAASKSSGSSSKSSSGTKTDTVDSLRADIGKTKANLKAAVARQRSLAAAKKNG